MSVAPHPIPGRVFHVMAALILFLGGLGTVRAITVVARDLDGLVARADTVFKGVVTAKTARWVGEGEQRHIDTFVTFRVEETYKGVPVSEQTLRFLGGTVDDQSIELPDMPRFEPGQDAVLFVVNNGRQFCPLVGIGQGRFHIVKDDATGRERVFTDDFSPVVNATEIGQFDAAGVPRLARYKHTAATALAAEDFRAEILRRVAAPTR